MVRVFKKGSNDKSSKGVDIALCVEMLSHAHQGNFDVGILVTGDADFIPLIQEVQRAGSRVLLWALSDGLSSKLYQAADDFLKLDGTLLDEDAPDL